MLLVTLTVFIFPLISIVTFPLVNEVVPLIVISFELYSVGLGSIVIVGGGTGKIGLRTGSFNLIDFDPLKSVELPLLPLVFIHSLLITDRLAAFEVPKKSLTSVSPVISGATFVISLIGT